MMYGFEMDEQPAFCTFSMEFVDGLDEKHEQTVALLVRVPLLTEGVVGVGEQEEVDQIRDTFEAVLSERGLAGVIHFASVRCVGQLDEWVYCTPAAIEGVEKACRGAFADREVEVHAQEDPEWEMYQSLMPDDEQMAEHGDLALISHFAESGDQLEKERDVTHVAMVPPEAADEATAAFTEAGYIATKLESEDEAEMVTVEVVVRHNLQPENVVDVRRAISAIAEQHGGGYDGWESVLVKE